MTTRAQYYRAERKHSQRDGVPKRKLAPVGNDIIWLSEWLQQAQGTGPFGVNSIVALSLGATVEERMGKLRGASRLGVLKMSAHQEHGRFVEYRWELTQAGTL